MTFSFSMKLGFLFWDAGLLFPFEGDNMLSIILSKAFMLAEDRKIKDETIITQIGTKTRK